MCENASWIEKNGEVLFLDDDDLKSKRGIELKKYLCTSYEEDKIGHGAIEWFYGITGGDHRECTDFSTPKNFPEKLVLKIKECKRTLFGLPSNFEKMLNASGKKEMADRREADIDWQKADADRQKADADWQKADADRQKAYADRREADADWQKADSDWQKAYADRQKADADWQKADADRQKAYADWQKAYADRQNANERIFWQVFSNTKNRSVAWI